MKELGITKGEWEISPDNNWECCILMGDQEDQYINLENRDIDGWDEMNANAELVADAGNTAQKCGLLPSELLRQRDELREALQSACRFISCSPLLKHDGDRPKGLERWQGLAESAIKSTDQ